MGRFEDQQREHGFARERRLDETKPERARPRLAGSQPLPASGAASEIFSIALEDLAIEERAQPGWCVRLGVPEDIPTDTAYDLHELIVELTIVVAGTAHALEVNAFPGCTVHLAGEQISARVKWGVTPASVPPGVTLRWQLTRGLCPTRGTRGYTVQAAPAEGAVPAFATGFALFSGDSDISEDIQLDFLTHVGGIVIQHYTKNDLLQAVGAFTSLPPGAGVWRWQTATASPARLVFSLGES